MNYSKVSVAGLNNERVVRIQNIFNGFHGCSLWVSIDKVQNYFAVIWACDVYVEILINMKKNNTKLPSGGRYVCTVYTYRDRRGK
jgi:hypothetical protein